MIWLAMSALGCCPNASGWSTLGSMLMYSYKNKSLQLLQQLFMSTVECYHTLIGSAFADHWLNATICSKTRAPCWNQSQQACCAFNQPEETLPYSRSPAFGIDCMFPALGNVGTKATISALAFFIRVRFHFRKVGSAFEPRQNKIKLCYSVVSMLMVDQQIEFSPGPGCSKAG